MADVAELSIIGRIATAADADWNDARQAWNLAADQRPAAVAFVEGADDVSAVLRFAAERGMKVNAQGTGHGAAPRYAARHRSLAGQSRAVPTGGSRPAWWRRNGTLALCATSSALAAAGAD